MRCSHPACTSNHNDRKYATLCPRTKENKYQQQRVNYWRNHDKKLEQMARYRTTAASMLAQAKYEASRRRGRTSETA